MSKERLPEKYPEVMNSGIEVRMWYCEQHKEYFSNNCSECMLLANDPDTIKQTRQATLREVGEWLEDHRIKGLTTEFYIPLREIAKLKEGKLE